MIRVYAVDYSDETATLLVTRLKGDSGIASEHRFARW
jgi:hypothetical protein